MSNSAAILEDDPRRVAEMRTCLKEILPAINIAFFEDAQQMIDWLSQHRGQVALISLDHDLPIRTIDGQTRDCGTGRQVADFLATLEPTCPVIVHSSNLDCAAGMIFTLKDAGWPVNQVYPRDDLAWIRDAWLEQIRANIHDGWLTD